MNPRHLMVLLDRRVAGTLSRLKGGTVQFSYDARYRASPDSTPLSVTIPLLIGLHPDRAIAPWLWGLLPDNEGVRSRWSREFRVSARSAFELLGTPVGRDCAGAVQFVPEDDLEDLVTRPGEVAWLTEKAVAERLSLLESDATTWLGGKNPGQFSLAGSQAKTALLFEDGRWGVPRGAIPTSHILKPAIAGLEGQEINEHLCLAAARRAGLFVAESRVLRFENQTAIVLTRYDRYRDGGQLRRVHQEDLCQALGLHPDRKYQSDGGPSPEQIVGFLRRVMPPAPAAEAVGRFVDALAWNWLIGGTDAHAKNYSLLLSGPDVRLALLYDITSALPYYHERKLKLAMKLGGDYRLSPWKDRWGAAAASLGLAAEAVRARVAELADRAPDAFREAAGDEAIRKLGSAQPAKLTDLVADRARRCRALLDRSAGATLSTRP